MSRLAVSAMILGLLFLVSKSTAQGADPKHDVSGNWDFQTNVANQKGTPQFVLKLEGNQLSGKYIGQFGQADLTGTVDGDKIEFKFASSTGNANYKGTITDKDTMKGEADYGSNNTGTWTAARGTGKLPVAIVEAERRAKELAKAFDSGEFAVYEKFMKENFAPAMLNSPTDRHETFFRNIYGANGGLEYHSIQETRPNQIVALFKSKKTGGWAAIRIGVQPTEPYLIQGLGGVAPVPPKDAAAAK